MYTSSLKHKLNSRPSQGQVHKWPEPYSVSVLDGRLHFVSCSSRLFPRMNTLFCGGSSVNGTTNPICITIPYNFSISFVLIQQSLFWSLFEIFENENYISPIIVKILHELTNNSQHKKYQVL